MNRDVFTALLMLAIGGFFAVHCFRGGRKAIKDGRVQHRFGYYERARNPGWFWLDVSAVFGASAMGAFFVIFGSVYLWILLTSTDL